MQRQRGGVRATIGMVSIRVVWGGAYHTGRERKKADDERKSGLTIFQYFCS